MAFKLKRRPKPVDKTGKIDRPDWYGARDPEIVFVVDPIVGREGSPDAPNMKRPISGRDFEYLKDHCKKYGVPTNKCAVIRAAPPVSAEFASSQKRMSDHLKENRDVFSDNVSRAKPKLIVPMGKGAASQLVNRSAKITQVRGLPVDNEEFGCLSFPMLGIGHVIRIPDNQRMFEGDFAALGKIVAAGYSAQYQTKTKTDYKWCTDLTPFLLRADAGPLELSVDIEGVGLRYYDPDTRILTVQLCDKAGRAVAVPIDYDHTRLSLRDPKKAYTTPASRDLRAKLVKQLRKLLQHKNVSVFGQNFKFDYLFLKHKLNIVVRNYDDDTICLMHGVDENMQAKSLPDITRQYVPELSGYSDAFDKDPIHFGKSRMDLVPPDKMLAYGCGDVDATWRAKHELETILKGDGKAYKCYRKVVMPALRAFAKIEDHGFVINKQALKDFEKMLKKHQDAEYRRLKRMVPPSIRMAELDKFERRDRKTGKLLQRASITRPGFLRAMLFTHKDGIGLEPRVFTKSTAKLTDESKRVPSTSGKMHLVYFEHEHPFISGIMEYIKNEKLLGTYVGTEDVEEGGSIKGFYKYLFNGRIRPTYLLHRAVTGRTTSSDPNGQNFPKRGKLAKKYREIFVAPPGYVLLEVDFSQIELRIAAIMANDKTMLRLYKEGADIHAATAAAVMGITLAEFNQLPKDERDLKRFQAKAVNFGFLYGMGWRKFRSYARTEYGIEFSEEEAQFIRATFFRLYKNLKNWHVSVREYVRANGFVRTFDGRVRHLPSVFSPDEAIASGAERQAINSPVQAFGSDLGLMALQLLVKNVSFDLVRPIGFIHDAIVCLAKESQAKEAAQAVKYWMEHIPFDDWFGFKPPIPIIAEAAVGKNLSSMIEIPDAWYEDPNVKSYYDMQIKDWEAIAKKAKDKGDPMPPKPSRSNVKSLVRRPRRAINNRLAFKPRPMPKLKKRVR